MAGKVKHGMIKTSEYNSWSQMIQRCYNPKHIKYKQYGARGVKVCKRWRRSFKLFLVDVGHKPSIAHTLDRIRNHIGYRPDNVRWATQYQQQRNRTNNVNITFRGQTLCMADWAKEIGIHRSTLHQRLRNGWSIERALTTRK